MLERIATAMGRNDEIPNIELAIFLCDTEDEMGIAEIVSGLDQKDKRVANDCMKVLYEIGDRKPELIAPYCNRFIELVSSKNNRLVWGAMTALSCIIELKSEIIFRNIGRLLQAYQTGSVITVDNAVTVFAKLCKEREEYAKVLFPRLLEHIKTCRPKEIAQHTERIAICITGENRDVFLEALDSRKKDLTPAQNKRVEKVIKNLCK
ncbi:hypothetical protein [Anaerosporobacter faecicola]|uniref:hypothetical protein n=1 Tax=Anaerosporobacter faecicola TaxID=2718714 RepID=UPI00143A2FC4|nr:hypothetical protein [Anaerosporobacter faecicola]